jgi:carbamoyltransferase
MFAHSHLAGLPPRRLPGGSLLDAHKNLAASTQRAIKAALLAFITTYRSSQDSRLCLAGGVAENSVAVGTLASAGLFDDIYVVHTQWITPQHFRAVTRSA